jgi:hypothetical protein
MSVAVVDGLADVPDERLEHEVAQHAAALAAATCRWLLMIAELDRRSTWAQWECRSMAHWLSWRCGLDRRTGRDHVRVARALEALPVITAAFAAGEVTYSKVRALIRVATAATEADLLETARHTTANQLERLVGAYARAMPTDDAAHLTARRFEVVHHDDGTLTIALRHCASDTAATIIAAAEAALQHVPTDLGDPYRARLLDALETVARAYIAPDEDKPRPVVANLDIDRRHVCEPPPAPAAAAAPETGSAEPPSPAPPSSWTALLDGLPVSHDTARELLCDASLFVAVLGDDGITRFVRRATTIPAAARRHAERRDGRQCRWPGCTNHAWLHAHHIQWRSREGNHATGNLVLLCPFHHRAVHRRGWEIFGDADAGRLVFTAPDGREITEGQPALPRPGPGTVDTANAVGSRLAPPRYEEMDLHWIIATLAEDHYPLN